MTPLRITLILIALCATFAASAQDGDNPNFYIPGMPVPTSSNSDEAPPAAEKSKTRGRIASVKRSDRDKDTKEDPVQNLAKLKVNELYRGIIPGVRDWHLISRRMHEAAQNNPRRKNTLTWIGFTPNEKGNSVWFQTTRKAAYSVREGADGSVIVTLIGTRVKRSNELRAIDTSYFPTAVESIDANRNGGNAVVTITLHRDAPYDVRQTDAFLYIDFKDAGSTPAADEAIAKEVGSTGAAPRASEAGTKPAKADSTSDGNGSAPVQPDSAGSSDSLQPLE